MARSLNKVQLIGNLTRDPELRYTPQGTAVCTFGIATNRQWVTDAGEKKEDVEFHRVVAWNKLAEICSQLLVKGRKVYVEGRLQTRSWTGQDGAQRTTTEVVASDMIILDSRREGLSEEGAASSGTDMPQAAQPSDNTSSKPKKGTGSKNKTEESSKPPETPPEDEEIPF